MRRFLGWLDSLNGRQDDQERDISVGFGAGIVLGFLLGMIVDQGLVRNILETCFKAATRG